MNTTELDIKKACRLSKSAKRCSECQKVAAAQSGVSNASSTTTTATPSSGVQQTLSAPSPEITFKPTSEPEPVLEPEPEAEQEQEQEQEQDNEALELEQEEAAGKLGQASSLEQIGGSSSHMISTSRTVQSMGDTVKTKTTQSIDGQQERGQEEEEPVTVQDSSNKMIATTAKQIVDHREQQSSEDLKLEEEEERDLKLNTKTKDRLEQQEEKAGMISDTKTKDRSIVKSASRSIEERHLKSCPSTDQPETAASVDVTKKQSGHHHHHHPHHHHHHHHHHHPHQHGHHHHHQHRQCPHHKHQQHHQQPSKENTVQTNTTTANVISTTASPREQQLSILTGSILTATVAASAGLAAAVESFEQQQQQQQHQHQHQHHHTDSSELKPKVNQLVSATAAAATAPVVPSPDTSAVDQPTATVNSETIKGKELDKSAPKSSKKRSVGSVEQFIRAPSIQGSVGIGSGSRTQAGSSSRRKSECNRMFSMIESSWLPIEERIESGRDSERSKETTSSSGTVRPASACCSLPSDDKGGINKQAGSNQRSAINQSSNSQQPQQQQHYHHHHHHHHHHHQQQAQVLRKSSLNIQEDKPKFTDGSNVSNTNTRATTTTTAINTTNAGTSKSSSNANMATASSFFPSSSTNRKGSAHTQHQPLKGTQSVSVSGIPSTASQTNLEVLAGSRQNIDDLEKELEALKVRLDRRIGGVKMSKVTQSYLSYFKQWAEYDPFIAQPIPSNPWISDSTELWDLERQTKDVHCRRVRRWAFSLKELLNDPAGREQFHRFLEKEFSAENLK